MDKGNYSKLSDIMDASLTAHSMADWNDPAARRTIINIIVRKFKEYMKLYEEKK